MYTLPENGKITIIGKNPDAALPEDGILRIPDKVDGYTVTYIKSKSGIPFIPFMQKIIVPKEIGGDVFNARIIEFESENPGKDIGYYSSWPPSISRKNIIVPDGCRDAYIATIKKHAEWLEQPSEDFLKRYVILEKTESINKEWVVDGNGLLKAYFGMETNRYVLPDGVKKLDFFSFSGADNPETIILNEGLEEIAANSINFSPALEEIRILKSVKYIGQNGVFAKKIYLYHNTEVHEQVWHLSEFIYLD